MKPPKYTRTAKHRAIGPAPAGIHIVAVSAQVRYVGSLYHKDVSSFAGNPPQPRPEVQRWFASGLDALGTSILSQQFVQRFI